LLTNKKIDMLRTVYVRKDHRAEFINASNICVCVCVNNMLCQSPQQVITA